MAAQPFSTGPAHFYISFFKQSTIEVPPPPQQTPTSLSEKVETPGPIVRVFEKEEVQYLGTTERTPRIEIKAHWMPLFTDIQGPAVPTDMAFLGLEAFITADFTRWDNNVLRAILERGKRHELKNTDDIQEGSYAFTSLGALLGQKRQFFVLWIQFPYSIFTKYNTQEKGFRFPATFILSPDDHYSLGTNPRKVRILFQAMRLMMKSDSTRFILFDHNMEAPPAEAKLVEERKAEPQV